MTVPFSVSQPSNVESMLILTSTVEHWMPEPKGDQHGHTASSFPCRSTPKPNADLPSPLSTPHMKQEPIKDSNAVCHAVSFHLRRLAQWQQHRPNNNNTGPTTTTQAQQQHQKPNDNTASWTMTWQAQWRWHKPNDDARSHLYITRSKFVEDCSAGTTPLICMSCSYVPPVATSCIFLKYVYFTAKCQLRPVMNQLRP